MKARSPALSKGVFMEKDFNEDRSREKLSKFTKDRITKMFITILDYVEVAVPDKDRYSVVRAKVLDVANDAIRDIDKELNDRYKVEYLPPAEDVIKVERK